MACPASCGNSCHMQKVRVAIAGLALQLRQQAFCCVCQLVNKRCCASDRDTLAGRLAASLLIFVTCAASGGFCCWRS
jgi:hypothetical protein